ncbi:regulator of G-protein signaling 11 [Narcine bancroftii]|uniref:regulator of G-protein signaling 11 n=1 Tax=Narcine bancroftii TaxID=1343680 RepID=UPI003831DCE8
MPVTMTRHHPRSHTGNAQMACLGKMEKLIVAMQNPDTGMRTKIQRFRGTPIAHTITGHDIFEWLLQNVSTSEEESFHLGDLIIKYGYIYPLKDPKNLILRVDDSPYRFQTPYFWTSQKWPATELDYAIYLAKKNIRKQGDLFDYEKDIYNLLHTRINHTWDFVVMQAREQLRAAKQRKRSDRIVLDCQEHAYWMVNRPPPGALKIMESGPRRNNIQARIKLDRAYYRREIEYYKNALTRSRVASSVSLEGFVKHCGDHLLHDPIMSGCLPSNPWITSCTMYWTMNADLVTVPTNLRVQRWAFSFHELLHDPLGRQEFRCFLEREFSAENLSFWEACEDVQYGEQSKVEEKVEAIFEQFLAAGASKWVNVDSKTMEKTLDGLQNPHRYVFEDAQMHIYMLMKKDSYPRYLKSQMYKSLLATSTVPQETKKSVFPFTMWHRHPSQMPQSKLHDGKNKAALSGTVSQLCRFSHPLANVGVFTGTNIPDYSNDEPSWSHSGLPSFCPGILPTASSPSSSSMDPKSLALNAAEVSVEAERYLQLEDPSTSEGTEASTELNEFGWNTSC